MLLKKAIDKIEGSKVFKDFKKENTEYYLAHAFTMIDKVQGDWQVGYCNKNDKVVVFEAGKEVEKKPEEKIFKKPDDTVNKLDLKKVELDLEKGVEIAEDLLEEKYKGEFVTKIIAILQNLETELYNITLVTQSFNLVNVRVDAKTGKVLKHSKESILGLKKN